MAAEPVHSPCQEPLLGVVWQPFGEGGQAVPAAVTITIIAALAPAQAVLHPLGLRAHPRVSVKPNQPLHHPEGWPCSLCRAVDTPKSPSWVGTPAPLHPFEPFLLV